jgi:adenylate cyclase
VYIVWKGEVNVDAEETHLLTRRPCEIIGEQAVIENVRRGATMTAVGAVQLILVPALTFDSLVGPSPFARNLLRAISAKLNESTRERARRFAHEERLFGEFRAHVSPAVLNALLSDDKAYASPRCIDGVVLLTDIRGFSARAAGLEPGEVADQVGRYLNHAVEIVHKHEGLVDKFIGDAVLAVWGWPVVRGDHDVIAAFQCAQTLIDSARAFQFGGQPIEIGVGLNAGPMFLGNVGSDHKRQFTVLGEVVNLAARFEAMCKELDAPLVVSESVYKRLPVDLRLQLNAHPDQQPKGSTRQTVYSMNRRIGAKRER